MAREPQETYSEEETQRRFEALVKAALNTPPEHKTFASTPYKGVGARRGLAPDLPTKQ